MSDQEPGGFPRAVARSVADVWNRGWPRRIGALAISLLLLGIAAWWVGSRALLEGVKALTPTTIAAALLVGLSVTSAQALRWRILASQRGIDLTFRRALADCYASSFGNMVLPGGLGGDAARVAVYRNRGSRRWVSPLLALGAERLSATTVLFAAVSVTLVSRSVPLAAGAGLVALACLVASIWCMPDLGMLRSLAVWASSILGVASLTALYLMAMASLGGPIVPVLAVVGLASMSIPLGVGGWGVREVSVSALSSTLGVSGDHAVATATAYGLLATISCLPGLAVLLLSWGQRRAVSRDPTTQRPSTAVGAGRSSVVPTDTVTRIAVGDDPGS